jgi:hypothetical protein
MRRDDRSFGERRETGRHYLWMSTDEEPEVGRDSESLIASIAAISYTYLQTFIR